MKVIKPLEILSFFTLIGVALALSFGSVYLGYRLAGHPLEVSNLSVVAFLGFSFIYTFAVYFLFLKIAPIPRGVLEDGSSGDWYYHVHILFYLMFFYPILNSQIIPVPIRTLMYKVLGAKLGLNTYPAGMILDPQFVEFGDFCIVGMNALICPHIMIVGKMSHEPIVVGDRVTIGVAATVYGGVTIGDGATVLPHAVVRPNTQIKAGEVWGGVPARLIRPVEYQEEPSTSQHDPSLLSV